MSTNYNDNPEYWETKILSLENEKFALQQEVVSLQQERENLYLSIDRYKKSTCWRLTYPIRKLGDIIRTFCNLAKRGALHLKRHGIRKTFIRIVNNKKIEERRELQKKALRTAVEEKDIWIELNEWIDKTPHDFIDIFAVPMGWSTPLFQRFQHLSLQAGNIGGISFYGAHPEVDTDITVYKIETPTLCLINLNNSEIYNKLFEILDKKSGLKYIRIQSIDLATTVDQIENFMQRGYIIIYEYIDEITPHITGDIPDFVYLRHKYILCNEEIIVIATSDKLFEQVQAYRTNNMTMINNGVDYEYWHISRKNVNCPPDLLPIVLKNKIIVGYHGALARWIDYELLKKIAADCRFVLLLIGYEHDSCLKESGLLHCPNVYYLGSKKYTELSKYTAFYDIAILPFIINDITLSVSPVKIFEYMAAEKPVVSYALPECLKYSSCLCASTQEEFLKQIDSAVELRNSSEYIALLNKDALDNTWSAIAQKTVSLAQLQYNKNLQKQEFTIQNDIVNHRITNIYKDNYLNDLLNQPKAPKGEDYRPLTDKIYTRQEEDCKIIAYYLTQFHPDKHNEEWWGKGVTEWNNVTRALPQYVGHYQPRVPGELGYYDLRIAENMKRQIELAKLYGIYGFSFYYYWFNGERLLEKPLEMFLEHKEIDFPFSLCWANENWTRRFDGTNTDILMEQPNSIASYKNVIEDISRFLNDPRYIKVEGKKLLTVYRPSLMPNSLKIIEYWRKYCKENNYGELYIIAIKENSVDTDWLTAGFDAVSEFHPGTLYTNCKNISNELQYIRKDFAGEIFSYKDIVMHQKYFYYNSPKLYRAVMPMWDNTARRDNKGMIFHGSTPILYKKWLCDVIKETNARNDLEDNLIFVNAWNEWGEGAYLEPDKKYGYAYLEATRDAIMKSRKYS